MKLTFSKSPQSIRLSGKRIPGAFAIYAVEYVAHQPGTELPATQRVRSSPRWRLGDWAEGGL